MLKIASKKIIGIVFIILGIIGWIMPIVPGLWLVLIGLELLGLRLLFQDKLDKCLKKRGFDFSNQFVNNLKMRYNKIVKKLDLK